MKGGVPAVKAMSVTLFAALVGALVAWAGSQGSAALVGVPIFALAVLLAYGLNWLMFVPSFLARTERYFDLSGSLTFIGLAVGSAVLAGTDARGWLIASLVVIWALRLGSFLFMRIREDGRDGRFDSLKNSAPRFLMVWTLQGLWVTLTLGAGLAALTSPGRAPLGILAWLGTGLWVCGFAVEVVADMQKRAFRKSGGHDRTFISKGLWAWSRHPNYFGEIVLWAGIALIAAEALVGWQWVMMISPVFVWVLLTRISGVPMLESRAMKRWGTNPDYQRYCEQVPVLWPKPPKRR